jgi:PAS domain S-box-containing protein
VNGVILEANRSTSLISGYSQEELVGMNVRDLEAGEVPGDIASHIKRVLKRGHNSVETKLRKKSEEIVDVEVRTNYLEIGEKRALFTILHDITERKQSEDALRDKERELKIKTGDIEEANTALRVLLKRREEDKAELEEKVLSNVKELILPYVAKLNKSGLNEKQKAYVAILESSLDDIVSPFSRKLSSWYLKFTPAEMQIANLIRGGKSTKEIAELLSLSSDTIETHRKNIRRKIGINNKRINLRTCLSHIQ